MSPHYSLEDTAGIVIVRFLQDYIGPEAFERLNAMVEQAENRRVLLDFEGVGYISSNAFGMLLGLKQRDDAVGGKMALCGLTPMLRDYIHLIRLDSVFSIYDGREEAIAGLMAAKPQAPLG